jgi:hypothetical protein
MQVETSSLFAQVIQDHMALRERNQELEGSMPIERYKTRDPFENHPLFKTEEQALLEETMDGAESAVLAHAVVPWPEENVAKPSVGEDTLWGRSRDFDWGD